jgi:hypothetical protein
MNNEKAATPRSMKGHVASCNCDLCEKLRLGFPLDWTIEDTGGGCQWLRKGEIAITDGEAGLPVKGQSCLLIVLNGDYDEQVAAREFPSLEAAFADLASAERIYGKH